MKIPLPPIEGEVTEVTVRTRDGQLVKATRTHRGTFECRWTEKAEKEGARGRDIQER